MLVPASPAMPSPALVAAEFPPVALSGMEADLTPAQPHGVMDDVGSFALPCRARLASLHLLLC
jgi:hypothetical protein